MAKGKASVRVGRMDNNDSDKSKRLRVNSGDRTVTLAESNGTWMPQQNITRLPTQGEGYKIPAPQSGRVGCYSDRSDAEIDYTIEA